jgi:DNA repair protein RecO (recombination protein O)
MRSNFLFASGRDIAILTQAEMVQPYTSLRDDLILSTYAAYLVELLDRFTVEEDKHIGIYQLLADGLGWLTTREDVLLVARFYELRLLGLAGFRPQLFHCVACGEAIEEQDQFFSGELGGILCPNCRSEDRRAMAITAVSVKVLRYLQTRPWSTVHNLRLKRSIHTELENVMQFYITYVLERNLKSVDFLHRLRQEAALLLPPEDH